MTISVTDFQLLNELRIYLRDKGVKIEYQEEPKLTITFPDAISTPVIKVPSIYNTNSKVAEEDQPVEMA